MRWSQACKWSAGRVWGLKIQLKVAAVESCASKGNFWRWAERYQGSEVKGAACDWGENAEFSRRGDASCSEVPSWVTQWFSGYTSYFSVFPASRMLGESGVVLFLLEASLVQEAMLVQRHCMWKLLVVCSFLGCSFSLAEISSKASETSTPMRDSYWVSYLFFFFLNLSLHQHTGNNECKSIPQHVQICICCLEAELGRSSELSASDSRALTICNLLNILMSHRGYYSSVGFFSLFYSRSSYCNLNAVGLGLKEMLAGSMLCTIFLWQQKEGEWIVWFSFLHSSTNEAWIRNSFWNWSVICCS